MIHNVTVGDLRIEADESTEGEAHLRWLGSANSRDPATVLQPYFNVVFAEAVARKLKLVLHFEELSFFNSSTVGFLLRAVTDAGQRGLPLELYFNASLRWQAHNFAGIEAISKGFPLVKVVGAGTANQSERVSH